MAGNAVRICCYTAIALLAQSPALFSVPAQRIAAVTISEQANSRGLQRITLHLKETPLRTAVTTIAQQADLRLSYNLALIAPETRITVRIDDLPVSEAFQKVLSGTGLVADIQVTGNVLISREPALLAENGTVTGSVTSSKTKQPIAGATILVDRTNTSVTTDQHGRFRLTLPAGEHTLHIRALGMTRQSKQITVAAEQTVTVDVGLETSASVLDEVVVTGTVIATERKAITTPITVITAADIERRGITRIEQLLRGEIPGVVALDKGIESYNARNGGNSSLMFGENTKSNIYVRGASTLDGGTTPLKTYVDGVEILDPSYLGTIDPKSIERIEVITGPQAATVYGSGAMGGVMQIFTKSGSGTDESTLTVNLTYGMLENSFSDSRTPAHNHTSSLTGGTGPAFSYSVNAGYTYSGQWQPNLFSRQFSAAIGALHTRGPLTVGGSVSTNNGRNGTTNMGWPLAFRKRSETGVWGPGGLVAYDSKRLATMSSQTLALNLDYRPLAWWSHHMTIGKSQTAFAEVPTAPDMRFDGDTLYTFSNSNGQRITLGYNTTFNMPARSIVSSVLTLGVNGSQGEDQYTGGCGATKSSTTVIGCRTGQAPTVQRPLNTKSWGGFGTLRVGLFEQLYLTLGLRAERNPDYGTSHRIDWTPTNGVAYTFEASELTVKLLGSYGSATRPPRPEWRRETYTSWSGYEPARFIARQGNPDLTPEYSRGPQGGIELYYGNIGSLTVNHYSQKVTDLIQSVTVDTLRITCGGPDCFYDYPVGQYRNVATIRQLGWEATTTASYKFLTARGSYSWMDSRILHARSYDAGVLFNRIPSHSGSFGLSYAYGATSIAFTTSYMGKWIDQGARDLLYYDLQNSRLEQYLDRSQNVYAETERAAYLKTDMTASQQLTPWVSATLNITNLGNSFASQSREGAYYPTLGRQTQIGVALRFPRR